MSDNIKKLIENELSILIGIRIRNFSRAALALCVDFGDDVEYKYVTGPKAEEAYMASEFTIHVHSSWRLLKDDDICLSQDALFNHMNGFKWCDKWEGETETELFSEISGELNEIFNNNAVRVVKIEATKFGDLKVYMEKDYCLELFVDSIGDTESWRFLRKEDNKSKHFVVFDEG